MHKVVTAQNAQIPEDAWQPLADYPDTPGLRARRDHARNERLIVRRVHLHAQDHQTELFLLLAPPRVHHQPHHEPTDSNVVIAPSRPGHGYSRLPYWRG
ncbi:MAG: hypothetical protein ACR2H2_08390 [Solirubrobacteraceae bacterium]